MASNNGWILAIFAFYFAFSVILAFMADDTSTFTTTLTNSSFSAADANTTFNIDSNELNLVNVQSNSFFTAFIRIVTFRIGTLDIFPSVVVLFVNFINFLCLVIGGLLIYDKIRGIA